MRNLKCILFFELNTKTNKKEILKKFDSYYEAEKYLEQVSFDGLAVSLDLHYDIEIGD